jgi:predicted alpha/beta-fold hydrolase
VVEPTVDGDTPTLGGTQDDSPFRSPFWMVGPHLQTIAPALFASRARIRYHHARWDTPDGDFIDVARPLDSSPDEGTRPLVVVFHGLEGNAEARYVRNILGGALERGWQGIAPQFRGCGGTLNDLPRFYHSGDSAEIDWVVRRIVAERDGRGPLYVVGVSLGGNMLLKWLGEQGTAARALVTAAAAISAPIDLTAGGHQLGVGFNRFYSWMFLRTLKAKSLAKLERHAGLYDAARVKAASSLHMFDDVVTAPLHGFRDAEDYWARSSSKPWLRRIAVPTLVLNARNDPFLPSRALPRRDEVSSAVTLDFPDGGGHVGFVHAGRGGGGWLQRRVLEFLERHP